MIYLKDDNLAFLDSNVGQLALDAFVGTQNFIKVILTRALEKYQSHGIDANDRLCVTAKEMLELYSSDDEGHSDSEE
jgi:hypothetical protein